ncbi:MAG: V-type ATPase subunit [Oscillospiraceae bacterium]|nr:V-type ATPase subunit [Oscillospiraceae bacterium]
MAKKIKDTDYLFISTYLHSLERNLLTSARMERMIEAPTAAEAAKVLQEIGYGEMPNVNDKELSAVLAQEQEKLFQDLYRFVPDKAVVDVFKVKYDYHNLKALLKARAMKLDGSRLLLDAGRVPAGDMLRAVTEGDYSALPPALRQAAAEAGDVLSSTGDPQLSDFILDRAYYAEMLSAARETGSSFLVRYVQAAIDAANLRSAVRTLRMKKGGELLRKVLVEGGTVRPDTIQAAALSGNLEDLYKTGELREAAELGTAAANGGNLTAFEKACDDAVTSVAAKAKSVPFGVEAVVSYLAAKEIEFTAVRIIMSSRMAGIGGDTIRERLRAAYV